MIIILHVFVADLCPCYMSTLINAHVMRHYIFRVYVVVTNAHIVLSNIKEGFFFCPVDFKGQWPYYATGLGHHLSYQCKLLVAG